MRSSQCLSPGELALLVDGVATRIERAQWFSHLDRCLDCRTVLGEAASYVEETSPTASPLQLGDALRAIQHLPLWATGLAVTLVAMLAAGVALDRVGWMRADRRALSRISSRIAVEQLSCGPGTSYAAHRWTAAENGLAFGPSLGEPERAFRIGLRLVDLRVAFREGRTGDVVNILLALDPLVQDPGTIASLRRAIDLGASGTTLNAAFDRVEETVGSVSPVFLTLGIWAEVSRLAAEAEEPTFFEQSWYRVSLAAFRDTDLPEPQAARIRAIGELLDGGATAVTLDQIRRELRTLILLT